MSEECENPQNFATLRKRFLRHLPVNVTNITKDFGALNSNSERVNFVIELLNSCKIDIPYQNDTKSDSKAAELREKGNEMFKRRKLKEAWELYTKSLSYSEENGVNLALSYANRSAVLFEANFHKECLMDIERAFKHNYPDHLKPKLVIREKKAKSSSSGNSTRPHEIIPIVEEKHDTIACASRCVAIQEDQNFGRFVTAARDIKSGEVLAVEQPFACLLVNQHFSHCHECLNLCYNLIPCERCPHALYCSENCRTRAFESYHRYECPILTTIKLLELDKLKVLPLRISFLVEKLEEVQSETYRSDRYHEIHNLVTNTSKRSISDLFERATAAAVIVMLVKLNTSFFEERNEELFKEVLLQHMQTGPSNFHEITELSPANDVYVPEEIASGAFAFLSLLNHSCSPNVTRFCYGQTIVLRAIQDVKKGEQIFDNYGYHHAVMERKTRRKQLKSQYYFDCDCVACRDEWPLYDHLPSIGTVDIEDDVMAQLSSGDVKTAGEILEQSLTKLGELQEMQPCQSFCQMQEVVKQCFAIFGNKRRVF